MGNYPELIVLKSPGCDDCGCGGWKRRREYDPYVVRLCDYCYNRRQTMMTHHLPVSSVSRETSVT